MARKRSGLLTGASAIDCRHAATDSRCAHGRSSLVESEGIARNCRHSGGIPGRSMGASRFGMGVDSWIVLVTSAIEVPARIASTSTTHRDCCARFMVILQVTTATASVVPALRSLVDQPVAVPDQRCAGTVSYTHLTLPTSDLV